MKTCRPMTLMSLAWILGCASNQSAKLQAGPAQGPRLVSCAEASIAPSTRPRTSVELRYRVDADGKVSNVRLVPSLNANYASDATVAAATSVALSCVYEPALQGGQPVATTVSRWFTVDTPGAR